MHSRDTPGGCPPVPYRELRAAIISLVRAALGRQREAVEKLLGEAVGAPVKVALVDQSAANPPQRARRLSESEARAERLKVLKGRDPALEAAAEVLDLEVLE